MTSFVYNAGSATIATGDNSVAMMLSDFCFRDSAPDDTDDSQIERAFARIENTHTDCGIPLHTNTGFWSITKR